MNSYYVELTFELGAPAGVEAFDAYLDEVAEAFAALADVDGDISVDLRTGRVDLCMTLSAASQPAAVVRAVAAARTAVHAAGGCATGCEHLLAQMLTDDRYRMKALPSGLVNSPPIV